jgi:MFS family permease
VFGEQLFQLVPPFTLFDAARRGRRALAINLVGAAIIGAVSALLARATANVPQFLFLGIGFYAVFSWACALRERDRPAFVLTWASPAFVGIVIAYAADCYIGYAVSYWAAPYAERVFAVDKATLGFMLGAPAAVGGFLGAIFGGKLADILQQRFAGGRIMVIAIALVLCVPIMLVGYSTANLTLFYALAFAVQFVTATALGAAAAASQSLVLPRMRGVATGIFFLGTALLGLGLGPFTAGFVSEMTGDLAVGIKSSLIAAPIGLVAMVIAIKAAPKAAATLLDRARAAGEPV